jgi:hypothetical protein
VQLIGWPEVIVAGFVLLFVLAWVIIAVRNVVWDFWRYFTVFAVVFVSVTLIAALKVHPFTTALAIGAGSGMLAAIFWAGLG